MMFTTEREKSFLSTEYLYVARRNRGGLSKCPLLIGILTLFDLIKIGLCRKSKKDLTGDYKNSDLENFFGISK